jgi:hypothetical protein
VNSKWVAKVVQKVRGEFLIIFKFPSNFINIKIANVKLKPVEKDAHVMRNVAALAKPEIKKIAVNQQPERNECHNHS